MKIFQSNNIPALNAFVQSSTCVELLEQDKNYGLALQGYPEKTQIVYCALQYALFFYHIILHVNGSGRVTSASSFEGPNKDL